MKSIQATALAAFLIIGHLDGANDAKDQDPDAKKIPESEIQGAWELNFGNGARRVKFIGNGMWTITQSDPATGKVIFHHGGSYTFDGKTYVEKVEFATDNTLNLVGKEHTFELTLQGDVIHQVGVGNPWTEDWRRVKKK